MNAVLFCIDSPYDTVGNTPFAGVVDHRPRLGEGFYITQPGSTLMRLTSNVTYVEDRPEGVIEFQTASGSTYHLVPASTLQSIYNGSLEEGAL